MTIKKSPADFRVEEILEDDLKNLQASSGPFALYRLDKEGLATPEAIGRIARELKVPAGAFAYGGLKDKHASTMQHVTLKVGGDKGASEAPEGAAGPGWSIARLGYVPRSITSADIHRNRFTLTVRSLTPAASDDMDEAARLLSPLTPDPSSLTPIVFVNYFGDQRFGSARHGRGFIAKHLVKEDFEGALKLAIATEARKDNMQQKNFKRTLLQHWGRWKEVLPKLRPCPERRAVERLAQSSGDFRGAFTALPYLLQQLSVYAYQSYLWNAIARRVIVQYCSGAGKVIAADDPFGEMLFPEAAAIPEALRGLDLPLLARKTELKEPWKSAAEEVLAEEGLTVGELQIPGVRRPFFGEEPRALFVTAEDFQLSAPQKDEHSGDKTRRKRVVTFALPRGSYATVLLRALGQ